MEITKLGRLFLLCIGMVSAYSSLWAEENDVAPSFQAVTSDVGPLEIPMGAGMCPLDFARDSWLVRTFNLGYPPPPHVLSLQLDCEALNEVHRLDPSGENQVSIPEGKDRFAAFMLVKREQQRPPLNQLISSDQIRNLKGLKAMVDLRQVLESNNSKQTMKLLNPTRGLPFVYEPVDDGLALLMLGDMPLSIKKAPPISVTHLLDFRDRRLVMMITAVEKDIPYLKNTLDLAEKLKRDFLKKNQAI